MTVTEYKVIADFYLDKVAQEIARLQQEDWELLGSPGGMHTATLNNIQAPEELNVWHCWRGTLFYAVLDKFKEMKYDVKEAQLDKHRQILGCEASGEGLYPDANAEPQKQEN